MVTCGMRTGLEFLETLGPYIVGANYTCHPKPLRFFITGAAQGLLCLLTRDTVAGHLIELPLAAILQQGDEKIHDHH